MQTRIASPSDQRGVILLEGLIAILIFSMGILALVGLQAASINNSNAAKYRNEAAYFANQVIAQMWADNKVSLVADYSSTPAGAKYQTWRNEVTAASALPGAAANPPTIAIAAGNVVTVTVQWRAPRDPVAHSHVAVAQIVHN